MPPEPKRIYMHGGPQDGRFVHIGSETNYVEVCVPPSVDLLPSDEPKTHQVFCYEPRGRRTLQGVEIFEVKI